MSCLMTAVSLGIKAILYKALNDLTKISFIPTRCRYAQLLGLSYTPLPPRDETKIFDKHQGLFCITAVTARLTASIFISTCSKNQTLQIIHVTGPEVFSSNSKGPKILQYFLFQCSVTKYFICNRSNVFVKTKKKLHAYSHCSYPRCAFLVPVSITLVLLPFFFPFLFCMMNNGDESNGSRKSVRKMEVYKKKKEKKKRDEMFCFLHPHVWEFLIPHPPKTKTGKFDPFWSPRTNDL